MKLAARVKSLTSSPTLAITTKANQLKRDGVDVVSFGAGEPDFDTPDYIKEKAIKAIKDGFTKYTPSTGTAELKKAIVNKFSRDNNLVYDTAQIVVSNGAKHCLYSILQVICDNDDEVIIPTPYWVSYPQMVRVAGGKPVFIKTGEKNNFKITPEQFEKAIKKTTKALIINSPSNPTGSVYTRAELQKIADIAIDYGIYIISDEIYEKLVYDKVEHVSIASLNQKMYPLTFTVNGLSKAYSMTGWRIGYLAGPKSVVDKIADLQDHSTSCPNSIAQIAAVEALNGGEEFINKMKKEFIKRRDYMVNRINSIDKLSVINPQGAFYIFPNISKTGFTSLEFSQKLLDEAKVAVIPGIGFGDDRFIRLSFATSMEQIVKGLDRIEKWVGQL